MKNRMGFKRIGKAILASLKWTLKIIRDIPGLLGEKPILTAFIFLIIIGLIVFKITISTKQAGEDFMGNIIAEGYGVVFDIFVFGIIIAFFNWLGEKRRDIKRWKEEIDDFRFWKNEEATFRIVGNIRRLNKAGVSNLELGFCYLKNAILGHSNLRGAFLKEANLREVNLTGAILMGADLGLADLGGADLRGADLRGADLREANLTGANLMGADLGLADLGGADLGGADLKESNLGGADLGGANLRGADFRGADLGGADLKEADLKDAFFYATNLLFVKKLSLDQLSTVKTLFRAWLNSALIAQVKEKYPHLLEEPKESK